MKKRKSIALILLVVILLLIIAAFCGYQLWLHLPQRNAVFGSSYGISINIYAELFANYLSQNPVYAITSQGMAYWDNPDPDTGNKYSEIGKLSPIRLTEDNFDNCIQGAGWTAMNVDAEYIRKSTARAWQAVSSNGMLTYFILLENGDVFVCHGSKDDGISINQICYLYDLGDTDIFFDHHQ